MLPPVLTRLYSSLYCAVADGDDSMPLEKKKKKKKKTTAADLVWPICLFEASPIIQMHEEHSRVYKAIAPTADYFGKNRPLPL